MSRVYTLKIDANGLCEGEAEIGETGLTVKTADRIYRFDYADILDFRLIDYVIKLFTTAETVCLSHLGTGTEEFFENLWLAYNNRSIEAFFSDKEGKALIESEGEYSFKEGELLLNGKAKFSLYKDFLMILPHCALSRRVPFYFTENAEVQPYRLKLTDIFGAEYTIAKLGADSDAFYEKTLLLYRELRPKWLAACSEKQRRLNEGIEESPKFSAFLSAGIDKEMLVAGLFSLEDTAYWFAAVKKTQAAVELVTDEQSATYLYSFTQPKEEFIGRLRCAMEEAGTHRELIYLDNEQINKNPLYRMSIAHSFNIRFLRSANVGRIIHNEAWQNNIREFFNMK